MNDFLKRIFELPPEKLEILLQKTQARRSNQHLPSSISPQPRTTSSFPLSFTQQRLWFLHQLAPHNTTYTIPAALRITGRLDISALQRSFNTLVQRHEILRTTVTVAQDGQPVQIVHDLAQFSLSLVDSPTPADEIDSTFIQQFITAEISQPFDLTTGPLLRASLLHISDTEHILALVLHHIIADGWSIDILINEITNLYVAEVFNKPASLPELPVQYIDFAVWQRTWLQGKTLETQLHYWLNQLANLTTLNLPTDFPRPPVQTFQGDVHTFHIDPDVTKRLKILGQQADATLYMTLFAAFALLLSRYSGQDDIAIGSSAANRTYKEIEPLIGFFVTTLVLRLNLSGNPSFRELLSRTRNVVLEATSHQDLPFEKIVEELQPKRTLSYNPLFQVFFNFRTVPSTKQELAGLTLTALPLKSHEAMFDLMLAIEETEQELTCSLEYNSDIFRRDTIERMESYFRTLLTRISQSLDVMCADLQVEEALDLPAIEQAFQPVHRAPLSYHQERLWFIDQFEKGNVYPHSPVYHNLPLVLQFSSPVDAEVLERSLNTIISRHTALRTNIVSERGKGEQRIISSKRLKLEVVELTEKRDKRAQIVECISREAQLPFALDDDLLVRATLFQFPGSESVLVVTTHHIVADKRSLQIIAKELAEIYRATASRQAPNIAEVSLQYTDYTLWQLGLPAAMLEQHLFYWKRQLGTSPQILELPTSRPRPAIHTFTPAHYAFSLDVELVQRIRALSRQMDISEFVILLTGFNVLLHRYSQQDEVIVGTNSPGRQRPGLHNIVGPLSNLLGLRSNLAGNPTFRSLLVAVNKIVEEARNHQDLPFDYLVQRLNLPKDMSRTALFDVVFDFEEYPSPTLDMGQVQATLIDPHQGYGKYDLSLAIDGGQEEWTGTVIYNAVLYDRFMIEQMVNHLRVLLAAMISDEKRRIGEVALLDRNEDVQQLLSYQASKPVLSKGETLHHLFEEQVKRTPDSTAVNWGDGQLSYRELDERANQLAHYLQQQGVAPEELVALCLERSPLMIISILAVLKAGGAYLPLDPNSPEDRLNFVLSDARVRCVLTSQKCLLDAFKQVPACIVLDAEEEQLARYPRTSPLQTYIAADQLAYCIYTSGSTGRPKGVLVEHHNVVLLLENCRNMFAFDQHDVWTLFHSYSFDLSVWEMWGALLFGGRLLIVPSMVSRAPDAFYDLLYREQVTILTQTPSAFKQLVQAEQEIKHEDRVLAVLRLVIFGGEALDPHSLLPWVKLHGDQMPQLVNMYGITETTIHVTVRPLTFLDISEAANSVIGGPIPGLDLYLLDRYLQRVPAGVPAELYVGGTGVTRGYLNQALLTAERFIPDELSGKAGGRLYKSGDLARILPDGDIEYLGRLDQQVKIRGFRIEPGEIEAALREHPSIRDAVVLAQQITSDDTRLVAYLVTE
ncbi:MAG TPA: amino acid adenylation domain-containing protein, partial [Ktedonobacteraceae bacterium]|nr:amino acid adenylation domain-containing protein [Ktedonobacteraceae bacterium]